STVKNFFILRIPPSYFLFFKIIVIRLYPRKLTNEMTVHNGYGKEMRKRLIFTGKREVITSKRYFEVLPIWKTGNLFFIANDKRVFLC
ncbi:MAG: hypothetical protein UC961_01775, partial [Emergencia sp.]|nr:hypothetical protein [Emergencia sp.]